jgi:hypothetical protein
VTAVRVGLLHTVPALAGTFQAAVEAAIPGVEVVHVVEPGLLATAIRDGVTAEVLARVAAHLGHLAADGVAAVLVTCSSIGEAVDAAAPDVPVPVLRIDVPMATEAVESARAAGRAAGRPGRIAVLATLAATLGPTGRLIEQAIERAVEEAGPAVEVTASVVDGAVAARDAGDQAGHDRRIRDAVAAADADVVVLAQASMAAAAADAGTTVPVLTSPRGGVAALAAAVLRAG